MKTDLAIKYNGILSSYYIPYLDKSPLENYHASSLFFMLNDPDKDIRTNLKLDDKKYFRERIISMILGTDMA